MPKTPEIIIASGSVEKPRHDILEHLGHWRVGITHLPDQFSEELEQWLLLTYFHQNNSISNNDTRPSFVPMSLSSVQWFTRKLAEAKALATLSSDMQNFHNQVVVARDMNVFIPGENLVLKPENWQGGVLMKPQSQEETAFAIDTQLRDQSPMVLQATAAVIMGDDKKPFVSSSIDVVLQTHPYDFIPKPRRSTTDTLTYHFSQSASIVCGGIRYDSMSQLVSNRWTVPSELAPYLRGIPHWSTVQEVVGSVVSQYSNNQGKGDPWQAQIMNGIYQRHFGQIPYWMENVS